MTEPFTGEIRMFAGNFAPRGWAFCDGQLLAINQNDALFSLIGTLYGGDGRTTFGLPDLRGRIPIHQGQGPGLSERKLGTNGGAEQVTITTAELPSHNHGPIGATNDAGNARPAVGNEPALLTAEDIYGPGGDAVNMAASAVTSVGGGGSHDNMQPFLAVHFIIALYGVYPSRT